MPAGKWLRDLKAAITGTRKGQTVRRRPAVRLEALEDRLAPSATLVRDINQPTVSFGNIAKLTSVGSTLYFVGQDSVHGEELWKSDGTTAGTVLVKELVAGPSGSFPSNLTAVGGILFFSANDGPGGTELWKSDGTA